MDMERENSYTEEVDRLKVQLAQKTQEIKKMKESGLLMGAVFDGVKEEMMVIDRNYIIHDVNKNFLKSHGLNRDDVLGEKCNRIVCKSNSLDSSSKRICPLDKAKKTRRRVEAIHFFRQGKDNIKEVIRVMYPVIINGKTPKFFVEISLNATGYRSLINKIKASEKKYRAILDTATDAILSIDENQKIVLFNNAAQRIFGYSRRKVLGKSFNFLIPPQDGNHYKYLKEFLLTKKSEIMGNTLSLSALRKNGEKFPIELGLSFHEMGKNTMFTAIIRDVFKQKQLEKKLLQSERLAAVGETVAHVAHEIRNPLMVIGGLTYQINKNLTENKAKQKLEIVFNEINHLEKLVANLGDFTKEYKLIKRPVDINSVIEDVLKIVGLIHCTEKHYFKIELSPGLKEINCDPDKLKQVLLNVINNGVEAMGDGGIIRIITRKCSIGVEISISDEGAGITEEDLLHIFEPFYTTRKTGSGLGLCISYKIIEAHKGEIRTVSTPGKGTTFDIRLPKG